MADNSLMTKIISVVIVLILGCVLVPLGISVGLNSFEDSGQCANAGGFWNSTDSVCFDNSSELVGNLTSYKSFPLKTLVGGVGIMGILVIIGLFVVFKDAILGIGKSR